MTETRIDELLDELVPAIETRSDGWEDVLARANTTRRRYAALAVAALALLLVPTAVALRGQINDLFQGTPAPPAVSTSFESNNKIADLATQKGFGARFPHADVTKAHGVIQVQTADGPQELWAAPNDQGGLCWFIDFANDPAPNGVKPGFGGCDTSAFARPPSDIAFEGPGWGLSHPSLYTVDGRVNVVDATSVQVTFADGSNIRLPVVEGLFLGSLDREVKVTQVTAYDEAGNQVAQMTMP
jgi:hypothetical protein